MGSKKNAEYAIQYAKDNAKSMEYDYQMMTYDEVLETISTEVIKACGTKKFEEELREKLKEEIINIRIKRYKRYKNSDSVCTAIEALFMLSGLVIVSLVTNNVLTQVNVGFLSLLAGYSARGSIQEARIYDEAIKAIEEKKGMILAKVK